MTIFNPIETVQRASLQPTSGPQLVLAGSITAVVVFAALVQHALPQAALLPATCTALFVPSCRRGAARLVAASAARGNSPTGTPRVC